MGIITNRSQRTAGPSPRLLWGRAKSPFIAIVLLALHALALPHLFAEERVLPAGTEIRSPENVEPLVLDVTHFLVERDSINRANATAELNRKLQIALIACQHEKADEEPTWQTTLKWVGIGLAMGGAFALGVVVAR